MTSSESTAVDQFDQIESPPWSELPFPAVEKVYSFLNRSDQISMSQVCHNWRQEYSSPSLWRKVTFRFPDFEHITGMCPDVKFARRFGTWFHHVKIVCHGPPPDFFVPVEAKTFIWQLKLFLEALASQSQLLSISFELIGMYLKYLARDDAVNADIYQMISKFIQSQKRLQFVKMSDPFKNAYEIVKVLFMNNSETLRHLHVSDFCLREPGDGSTDVTVDEDLNFLVFMSLEKLEIDYGSVFEKMVLSFYECRNRVDMRRKGRFKEMKLVECFDDRANGIHPHVWKIFSEVFPDLKIDLRMDSDCDSISLSTLLVPEMPLRAVTFHFHSYPGHDKDVGTLLRHITLCGLNKSLEVLEISWYDDSPNNLAPDLTSFTNVCSELKTLKLHLQHPVEGLDSVFNSWLEKRPVSLQVVDIVVPVFHPITQEEEMIYTSLNEFYAPLLHPLKLSLSVDLIYEKFLLNV